MRRAREVPIKNFNSFFAAIWIIKEASDFVYLVGVTTHPSLTDTQRNWASRGKIAISSQSLLRDFSIITYQ
jgi:hypothetical protein